MASTRLRPGMVTRDISSIYYTVMMMKIGHIRIGEVTEENVEP
jgi:hypothetical protein